MDQKHQMLGGIPRFNELRYTEQYSDEFLTKNRRLADPLADKLIASLSKERPIKEYPDLLTEVRKRASAGDSLCEDFINACDIVPNWANFQSMELGAKLIAVYSPFMALSLFTGSLVGGAVFHKMAMIIRMTGDFRQDTSRRLTETSVMVVRLAFPGAIQPQNSGHDSIVRVRLLHAVIRQHLYDSGKFTHAVEVPINQQDLAITLGLFGYVNIRTLIKLGIRFSEDELESYILLWRYVGYVIGINENLLPSSVEDQQDFYLASSKHQAKPEKLTPALKAVLDDVAKKANKRTKILPFFVVQKFLHQVTRHFSGDDYVAGMEILPERSYWGLKALKGFATGFYAIANYVPGGRWALYNGGLFAFSRMLDNYNKKADAKRYYI